jgi:hypothetical protein
MALLYFFSLSFACCLVFVAAIPTFEHFNTWDADMGSLVPGASYIEMMGSKNKGNPSIKRYLNTFDDGEKHGFSPPTIIQHS